MLEILTKFDQAPTFFGHGGNCPHISKFLESTLICVQIYEPEELEPETPSPVKKKKKKDKDSFSEESSAK